MALWKFLTVFAESITIGVSVGSITVVFGVSITGWWLSHLPIRKMMESKSVGMMTFPTEWKNKNVPNHQPVIDGDTIIDIDGQVGW